MKKSRLFSVIASVCLLSNALSVFAQTAPRTELSRSTLQWRPLNEPGCGGWITSVAVSPHDSLRVLLGGDLLGVGLSENGGESWQSTFGFASWEIADFTWHPENPNLVWAGTMSGPYLSEDGGRNWTAKRNGFPAVSSGLYSTPIQKILFDPVNDRHLIAVGGSHRRWSSPGTPAWGAVWESLDGGNLWSRIGTVGSGGGRNIVAADFAAGSSSVLYAAADAQGVFVSEDGGKTWTARNGGLPHTSINDLVVHPGDPNTLWIALGNFRPQGSSEFISGGIYKSTNGGQTWQSASVGLRVNTNTNENFTARYQAIAASFTDPVKLVTCDTSYDGSTAYVSTNGGASWQVLARKQNIRTPMPAGLGMTVMDFDTRDSNTIFMAGSEYLICTRDGGATWTDCTAKQPDSAAGTSRWSGRGYAGWVTSNFKFNPRIPGHSVLIGLDHANFWQSSDNLQTWLWGGQGLPTWEGGSDVTFTGTSSLYVTLGQFGYSSATIARSNDGGQTWTKLQGKPGLPAGTPEATSIYALPDEPNIVWATINGRLYRSVSSGESWDEINAGAGLRWIAAASAQSPRRFYVSGDAGVYETSDGANFQLIAGSPQKATRMAVDVAGRLYVTAWRASPGGLWRYENGAWTRLRNDPFIANVAIDPQDTSRLVVVTNDHPYHDECFATGVWISSDGGTTWSQQNAGLPMLRGEVIAFNPHDAEQIVFGSGGRGFFITRWSRQATFRGGRASERRGVQQ